MSKLSKEEKQKAAVKVNEKIFDILKVNGIDWFDRKLFSAFIMIYQQGVKDCKELLK